MNISSELLFKLVMGMDTRSEPLHFELICKVFGQLNFDPADQKKADDIVKHFKIKAAGQVYTGKLGAKQAGRNYQDKHNPKGTVFSFPSFMRKNSKCRGNCATCGARIEPGGLRCFFLKNNNITAVWCATQGCFPAEFKDHMLASKTYQTWKEGKEK